MEIKISEEQSISMVQDMFKLSGITTTRTTDKYCKWDLENEAEDIRIEVKMRTLNHSTLIYYSEKGLGMILEDIKYQELVGHRNYYVNVYDTEKGTYIVLWNCNNIDKEIHQHLCAKSTTWDYNTKINKGVHYVRISGADKVIEFKDGKFTKSSPTELLNK
jgi:hypothetical protein